MTEESTSAASPDSSEQQDIASGASSAGSGASGASSGGSGGSGASSAGSGASAASSGSGASPEPLLRVVNPDATPEEIAAVVAVLSAIGSSAQPPPPQPPSEWAARHRGMRRSYPHGPNGWRNSALPR